MIHAFEVVILDLNKSILNSIGKLKNIKTMDHLDCWLTTAVSQPIDLGSSI